MKQTMEIEQTSPEASDIAVDEPRVPDVRGKDEGVLVTTSASLAGPMSGLLVLAGAGMQGIANGTIDALFFGFLLFLAGYALVRTVFLRGRAEQRAFVLTFGVCIFAGGAVQWYSLTTFGEPQTTVDAIGFLRAVFDAPPYYTWEQIKTLWIDGREVSRGAPLAVYIWQWVYHVRRLLGLDFGPYVGVMFNALVMGLTASVTVATARELFGDDRWRLRRVGTLFALCGLFILFGAILLRDCFTTFFNALVIWGIVRWLCKPNSRNLLFASILTGISMWAMLYLRARSVVLFGFFGFLAFMCWFLARRANLVRVVVALSVLLIAFAGSTYVMSYLEMSQGLQSKNMEKYVDILEISSRDDSLAVRLIVNQPLPVRLVLGTGSRMIFPIPLWAYFYPGVGEYHLIKGYHGIYQVLVMPLVLVAFILVFRLFQDDRMQSVPLVFLSVYLIITTLAVVATSLEQRHIAQFMPAFMILAAVPDTRERDTRRKVRDMAILWFFVVLLVHAAWALAARGR